MAIDARNYAYEAATVTNLFTFINVMQWKKYGINVYELHCKRSYRYVEYCFKGYQTSTGATEPFKIKKLSSSWKAHIDG